MHETERLPESDYEDIPESGGRERRRGGAGARCAAIVLCISTVCGDRRGRDAHRARQRRQRRGPARAPHPAARARRPPALARRVRGTCCRPRLHTLCHHPSICFIYIFIFATAALSAATTAGDESYKHSTFNTGYNFTNDVLTRQFDISPWRRADTAAGTALCVCRLQCGADGAEPRVCGVPGRRAGGG